MNGNVRAFVAVALPGTLKQALAEAVRPLERLGADVKWARPEGLHLTLKFLGDVAENRVGETVSALSRAVDGTPAFEAALGGTGCFPDPRRPSVLWVGVASGGPELARLAGAVDAALAPLGFEPERRPFHPHLTLGRVRSPRGAGRAVEALSAAGFAGPAFRVGEIHLMKSDLQRTGAVYSVVQTLKLAG